ncbi:hypothetical protein [Streptomyces misionensis]
MMTECLVVAEAVVGLVLAVLAQNRVVRVYGLLMVVAALVVELAGAGLP